MITHDTCEWELLCAHATNSKSRVHYYMRCHPVKDMEDGARVKVVVFGDRYWKRGKDKRQIRYVAKVRVRHRVSKIKYKGLTT